jgi:hypothetical protein
VTIRQSPRRLARAPGTAAGRRQKGLLPAGTRGDTTRRASPGRRHGRIPRVHEAIDELAKVRTVYWLGDTAVHLHALTSLIAYTQRLLPKAIYDARDQGHIFAKIGQLLNLSPRTAARRYRNAQTINLTRSPT